jgi:hypothetical protein
MSNVSFLNTDITRVRFMGKTKWGGEDGFKIIEETFLDRILDEKADIDDFIKVEITIESVLAAYRNLRENYEYRLRYDDAGKVFINEIELRRKYRTVPLNHDTNIVNSNHHNSKIVRNGFLRRHFSLTGLYLHLSSYGESILKPVITGIVIIMLSSLFWMVHDDPTGDSIIAGIQGNNSNVINPSQIGNHSHTIKALERSLADFLPLLSMPGNITIGVIDFLIKIVGGGLTFVLLGIALRRKFERKYTR